MDSVNGYDASVGFLRKMRGYGQDKVLRRKDVENVMIRSGVNSRYVASFICFRYVEGSRSNETITSSNNNNNNNNKYLCHVMC